ncbi:glycine cleavage system protein GcvH [bacterium]|nr:glycine cleavage system protein GcvH [bacterium]
MNIPDGILCSKTHEWVAQNDKEAVIGLTDWAVEQLGDVVFIELPEVGATFSKDEVFATIESVKAASEIYMPVGGEITEINEELINSPELINDDAFSAWLVKIKPENFQEDSQGLMEYDDYKDEVQ